MYRLFLLLLLTTSLHRLDAQNFEGGFPFMMPEYDSSSQIFLPTFPRHPIVEAGRVSSQGGQFLADGQPIRFWGVNLSAGACFPPKALAPGIAARMRKMGINLVRLHHLDNPAWGGSNTSIFQDGQNNTRNLNAFTLDLLDYFVAQLKAEGIYVNMNLNVSRTFRAGDAVIAADSLADFGKGPTLFDPWMQALQREYAEQLLSHANPYTGLALADDPVLAMVEMNNENSLYGLWKSDALRPISQGGLLPSYYNEQLDQLWLSFLWERYGNPEALAAAWEIGVTAGQTGQLMSNPGFEVSPGLAPWVLEQHDIAQVQLSHTNTGPAEGLYCAQLQVLQHSGTDWHIQLKQNGLSLQADTVYTLSFQARADGPRRISASVMQDGPPYQWYTGATFDVGPNWQTYSLNFALPEDVANARITLSPLEGPATFWLDDFRLGPPVRQGLSQGESLAEGRVARMDWTSRFQYTPSRIGDQADFYVRVQKTHFDNLRAHLRDELGVTAPITGTNALVGPADAAHQEDLDYLDDHSYWDHPGFPGAAWDPANWFISNQPQLRDPYLSAITSAFSGLALANKPFTLSEYNHGAPNRYRVEMPHLLTAYAALHQADGIMFFDYNGSNNWGEDRLDGFFGLHRDHSVMALFPSCARAFRQGMVQGDTNPLEINYSAAELAAQPLDDNGNRWQKHTPYDRRLALTHGLATGSYRAAQGSPLDELPIVGTSPYLSSTGETSFAPDAGLLSTTTPSFVALTGFLGEATGQALGEQMALSNGSEFGAITWVSLTDVSLLQSPRSLLTISSAQQNTGMIWDGIQTVNNHWGTAPTQQRPISGQLLLHVAADYLRVYPLNAEGQAGAYTELQPVSADHFLLSFDQSETPSLWFGLEARGGNITASEEPGAASTAVWLRADPSPLHAGQPLRLSWAAVADPIQFSLSNSSGQVVYTWQQQGREGEDIIQLPTQLAAGVYQVSMRSRAGQTAQCRIVVLR